MALASRISAYNMEKSTSKSDASPDRIKPHKPFNKMTRAEQEEYYGAAGV